MDLLTYLDPEHLTTMMSSAFSNQVTQFTLPFALAAWIHSGRVKKEIKSQFSELISVVKADLSIQSERMNNIEKGLTSLTTRVDTLVKGGT